MTIGKRRLVSLRYITVRYHFVTNGTVESA